MDTPHQNLDKPIRKRRARLNPTFKAKLQEQEALKEAKTELQRKKWLQRKNNQLIRQGRKSKDPAPKYNWNVIRTFAEQNGIQLTSQTFAIRNDTLYKKAKKQAWNIPKLLIKRSNEELQTPENKLLVINDSEKWQKRAEDHKELIHNLVSRAFKNMEESGLPDIETPSDAKIYDEVQRKTLGLDKTDSASQNLQVNLAFLSQP